MSRHGGWSGARVTKIRAALARRILIAHRKGEPLVCPFYGIDPRCTGPLLPGQAFDVQHVLSRVDHPEHTWNPNNWTPSHARCNRADGARMTNERTRTKRKNHWDWT